ncbi:transcription factor, MBF1 [Thioploca ingrica]|uniref:Transcription factor, MBF1 n=1 Tax=Thioploca ingrica TaxID=40754 RepID=A0A090ADY0_9GAMM|nr:transcription factor, MBF1 [Thioploca ingrica]
MKVHEKIRFMRQSKNWSQEEMADKLGMSTNGYANIERGETDVPFSRLEQIAKTLDVELLELLSFGERNIFYLVTGDNSQFNNHIKMQQSGHLDESIELQHELEKMYLILKQRENEIEYLKEIINLMKK